MSALNEQLVTGPLPQLSYLEVGYDGASQAVEAELVGKLFEPIDLSRARVVTDDKPEESTTQVETEAADEAADIKSERYARSLRLIRMLGHAALNNPTDVMDTQEAVSAGFELETSLGEMLGSHPDLSKYLKVNIETTYDIDEQGRAVTKDGRSLLAVTEAGLEKSREAAQTKDFMVPQVERDTMDVEVMKKADALEEGQTMVVVSMYPKEMLESEYREYWMNWMSYGDGHSFIQYFSKQNGQLIAGSLSASESTMEGWNAIWAEYGVEVPDDVDHNHRIGYPIIVESDSAEEARTFAEGLQERHYRNLGETVPRVTAAEILFENQDVVDAVKRELYVPLSTATVTGHKNEAMHNYAAAILRDKHIDEIDGDLQRQLRRIYVTDNFVVEDSQTMDYIIQFGTVKVLLERVRHRFTGNDEIASVIEQPSDSYGNYGMMDVINNIAAGVGQGAADGDKFVGCGGVVPVSSNRTASSVMGGMAGGRAFQESSPWHSGKIFHDQICQSCGKMRKEVGWCGICKDCVSRPAFMQLVYERRKLEALSKRVTFTRLVMKLELSSVV